MYSGEKISDWKVIISSTQPHFLYFNPLDTVFTGFNWVECVLLM
jgi:hypothetical protein